MAKQSIDLDAWYDVRARSGSQQFWVTTNSPHEPELGPWKLPDGRNVNDEIAYGRIGELPFHVPFIRHQYSRGKTRGDILWAVGLYHLIVTQRFIDALSELGVEGFKTYPVDLKDRDRARTSVPGYVGFVPDLSGESDVHSPHVGELFFFVVMRGRVLQGLLDRGVSEFDYEPYVPYSESSS